MKETTNFKLNKPENTDIVDITKLNENMDILDAQVETNKTDILTLNTTVGSVPMTTTAQTATGAINELDADTVALGEQINNLATNKADLVNGKIPSIQLPNIEVPVQSVNSKTGAVVLTKTDIGLGNVDNSVDSAKAVLSATKLATPRAINGVAFDGTVNITVADGTKAPTSHASTGTGYGIGTTANYGHVKTINALTQASHVDGTALSAYQGKVLNDNIINSNFKLLKTMSVTSLAPNSTIPLNIDLNNYSMIYITLEGSATITITGTTQRTLNYAIGSYNGGSLVRITPATPSTNINYTNIFGSGLYSRGMYSIYNSTVAHEFYDAVGFGTNLAELSISSYTVITGTVNLTLKIYGLIIR